MLRLLTVFLLFTSVLCDIGAVEYETSEDIRKPVYKYRYETDNVMKTAESQIPIHGYHVVEGGFYPGGELGGGFGGAGGFIGGPGAYGGKFIGGPGIGAGGIGVGGGGIGLGAGGIGLRGGGIGPVGLGAAHLGYGPGLVGAGGGGIGGAGIGFGGVGGGKFIAPIAPIYHHHGFGGEEVDQKQFSEGKKGINDERFEKAHGKKGAELQHGQEGFTAGKVAVKEAKGDSGYYSDVNGGKKVVEDGKNYQGGQHYNQEGKNGAEKNLKQGHKKGHIIKGFKTSHHKDETGKTEEYYDEENDEGGQLVFNGQAGAFGEKGASSFKGGHEDGKFNSGEQKKSGHYGNEYLVDKANADSGKYGENKYAGNGAIYGANNGIDSQSLLGHQEESRFFKHQPVPFYHHY